MALCFSPESLEQIAAWRARFPDPRAALMPALWLATKEFGHLSDEVIDVVAEATGLPAAQVRSTATFYTMWPKQPVGRHTIWVCQNLSCTMMGAEELLERLKKRLRIAPGETTADGKITLLTAECLGACGTAPVLQVDEEYHEQMNAEKLDALLDRLLAEEPAGEAGPPPGEGT